MTRLTGALADLQPWTSAELQTLGREYARGGIHAARAALPHRSEHSIYHRARRLNVLRRRRWTKADDAKLRALWNAGDNGLEEIAEALRRTVKTTYHRAQELGLKLGCPPGWEYLNNAAERCGYTTSQLRAVLAWAGVDIHSALARPTERRGPRRGPRRTRHIVWPSSVDAAISAWLETEPLHCAARRVGVCSETLGRWLRAIGVEKPVAGKAHWRVHEDDVARAVAAARELARAA